MIPLSLFGSLLFLVRQCRRIALLYLDDAAVFRVLLFDELAHLCQHLVDVPGVSRREHQIKQNIGVAVPRHDPQIVDGEPRVQLAGMFLQTGPQHPHRRVRRDDGVVMDGDLQPVFFEKVVLDVLNEGFIPVVSSVAAGMDEETNYNINADTAAEKLAVALKAKKLILLTDVCGLMRDPKDDSTLIPRLKVSEVPALIKEGVISGGMIPKVDCCVEAVRQGVERANIQDGRVPHSILVELLSDDGVGTMFS